MALTFADKVIANIRCLQTMPDLFSTRNDKCVAWNQYPGKSESKIGIVFAIQI